MTNDADLDAMIASGSSVLGITVDPAWRESVRANLAVTLRLAGLVDAFPLPDDLDPAPVFRA